MQPLVTRHHRRPLVALPVLVAGLLMLLAVPPALLAAGSVSLVPVTGVELPPAELSVSDPIDHVVAAVRDGAPRVGALAAAVLLMSLVVMGGSHAVELPGRVAATDLGCPPRRARRRAPPPH
jgi:hypothetical protein